MKKLAILILVFIISLSSFGKFLKAYDFSLKDENGNTVKLSDYKGDVIFLIFWSTHCKTCEKEMPKISKELIPKFKGKPVKFFAVVINTDNLKEIKKVKQKWGFDIPVLIGTRKVKGKYRIFGTPTVYILRKDLSVGRIFMGKKDLKVYEKYINKFLNE
jgi:peroxiredoxin